MHHARALASRRMGRVLALIALGALPAGRAWPAPPARPALIIHTSAASRAELERAVSQALGGAPVRLADDALTRDSLLIVAPAAFPAHRAGLALRFAAPRDRPRARAAAYTLSGVATRTHPKLTPELTPMADRLRPTSPLR
jgi:hypothetical protein